MGREILEIGSESRECEALFRLRTGSAGLLADKKRCRMISDERCKG